MPRHYAEATATFDAFSQVIASALNTDRSTRIVDLGCGPGTAGLAFADHSRGHLFHYLGIDKSNSMRRAARNCIRDAQNVGLHNSSSRIAVASGTYDITSALSNCRKPVNIIFVASYLFASKTIDIELLCRIIKTIRHCDFVGKCAFIYINSTTRFANRKYETLISELGSIATRRGIANQVIGYRDYAGRSTRPAQFVNDCLLLKGYTE